MMKGGNDNLSKEWSGNKQGGECLRIKRKGARKRGKGIIIL